MREYKPKGNAQRQTAYKDRFYVAPQIPKEYISEYPDFVNVVTHLNKSIKLQDSYVQRGQLVIFVKPNDNYKALEILRDNCGYDVLSELSAIDFIEQRGEFEVFYQMLNLSKAKRLRVKISIKETESINSVTPLFKSANWAEREMFDMYGVKINNHPYLKRILMPDDWQGHPLRKDYPLQGDEAASWYEVDKIFGKEYRDIIGPEERDAARVEPRDTQRFARYSKEVAFGADPDVEDLAQQSAVHDYDKNNILVEKFKTSTIIEKRR
jgi:NADH-quinone oxidoreductase subunit C